MEEKEFVIGNYKPTGLVFNYGNQSAILIIGTNIIDLKIIDFNSVETIEIDGVRFVREKDNE